MPSLFYLLLPFLVFWFGILTITILARAPSPVSIIGIHAVRTPTHGYQAVDQRIPAAPESRENRLESPLNPGPIQDPYRHHGKSSERLTGPRAGLSPRGTGSAAHSGP